MEKCIVVAVVLVTCIDDDEYDKFEDDADESQKSALEWLE